MKNLFIGIILLIILSCSSNPKNTFEVIQEGLLIEKPLIDYKLKYLPKDINVIYLSNSETKETFPDEIKGLLTNYYSFSKKNKYFPYIKFVNLNSINACSLVLQRDAYNFIFVLEDSTDNRSYDFCLKKFVTKDNLLIADFDNESIPKKFKRFLVNRNDDKYELIKLMNAYGKNAIVIDNEVTEDKYEIGKLWENEFKKEISEYKTFSEVESSQEIFSNLLLIDQSLKRKRKLSRILSKDLNHKSRARRDIDALFLSVNTQEARSLKPALDYYNYFENMEVFLANDWKGESQFLESDKDLEGVISIDIPFMLPSKLPNDLRVVQNKSRNFAMGYDAFEIMLLLKSVRNLNRATYKGLSGKITFKDNSIQRKSTIFKIENGTYVYLN